MAEIKRKPYFMVPSDYKIETAETLAYLNKKYEMKVEELYGNVPINSIGSGRRPSDLPQITLDDFREYVNRLENYGMKFHYTLNTTCMGNGEFTKAGQQELIDFVGEIYDCGVRIFTVAIPPVVDILGKVFPDIEVTVSTIYGADSVMKIKELEGKDNVRQICLKEDVNRDFNKLKKLAKCTNLELTTIINSCCILDCPMRNMHYNFESHAAQVHVPEYYLSWCMLEKIKNPEIMLRMPFIRPEDLHYYIEAGIVGFKIGGREHKNADIARSVEAYMMQHYDGNLYDLLLNFSRGYVNRLFYIDNRQLDGRLEKMIKKTEPCIRTECDECGICKPYFDKLSVDTKLVSGFNRLFNKNIKDCMGD